jgi:titin
VKDRSKDFIDLVWSSPETDGGTDIRQYVIEKCDVTRGIGPWMVCGTASPSENYFRASKLFPGNAYQFRVSAENRVGSGQPAEILQPVVAQLPFGELREITLH